MTCSYASSGCNHPEGECIGLCLHREAMGKPAARWMIQVQPGDLKPRLMREYNPAGNYFLSTANRTQAQIFESRAQAQQIVDRLQADPLWTAIEFTPISTD